MWKVLRLRQLFKQLYTCLQIVKMKSCTHSYGTANNSATEVTRIVNQDVVLLWCSGAHGQTPFVSLQDNYCDHKNVVCFSLQAHNIFAIPCKGLKLIFL